MIMLDYEDTIRYIASAPLNVIPSKSCLSLPSLRPKQYLLWDS